LAGGFYRTSPDRLARVLHACEKSPDRLAGVLHSYQLPPLRLVAGKFLAPVVFRVVPE